MKVQSILELEVSFKCIQHLEGKRIKTAQPKHNHNIEKLDNTSASFKMTTSSLMSIVTPAWLVRDKINL